MGMRIRTNIPAQIAQRFMGENKDALNKNLERLASGYRINRSADDAAGLAISENLRGKVRGLNVAKRNANDAISFVQVAEGSMNEMTNILIRLRELAVQASSDTIGNQERGFLNREYVQLVDEIDRIGNSTEFNGIKFFDANNESRENFVIQVGTNGTTPDANEDTIQIDVKGLKFNTASFGLGKANEIGPYGEEEAPERSFISQKLTVIDNSLQRLASERATLGSVQSRLNSAIGNLSVSIENMEHAKSRIKDVDFAEETADLTQNRVLTASNTAVLSQANAAPEQVLQLLRS